MMSVSERCESRRMQQQQLASLLSAALDTSTTPPPPPPPSTSPSPNHHSSRLAAIHSLHRAILFPPNSLLLSHSAPFLAQGLSQLLSDKSILVRQSAATTYGALCGVVSSVSLGTNTRQNHVMLGSLVDRFIAWAVPLLGNVGSSDGTAIELAIEGLREFLSVGDLGVERYALPILKACQQVLEDERTSLNLLHRILGVLTLLSSKFYRVFNPHFVDIVDLLLGWVLVPDLGELDRQVIMDCLLQFQKHWAANLQFSLGLLNKFLGDMDVLLQDGSHGTPQQFWRLLMLLSCFSTVLQSTATGLLEMNLLDQITEFLTGILPRLLGCLSMVGRKFGWSKWTGDLWKCLTLLAEILGERFSSFYLLALDILYQSLQVTGNTMHGAEKLTSFQIHGVLKTNLQLLSLQKMGILTSSVKKLMQFDAPISQLRLHPNHLVAASSAATYIFLLQHGNDVVVQQAITVLKEELELLKGMLKRSLELEDEIDGYADSKSYSKDELCALMKFDMKVLLTCISLNGSGSLIGQLDIAVKCLKRVDMLVSFITEKLNPFDQFIETYLELQVNVMRTLAWLSEIEFSCQCSIRNHSDKEDSMDASGGDVYNIFRSMDDHSSMIVEHLNKYSAFLVKGLQSFSPSAVKVAALEWIQTFCKNLIAMSETNVSGNLFETTGYTGCVGNIIFSVLDAASDKEPKVRSLVALVLESLFNAGLIKDMYFYPVAEVILDKLGDPDADIKSVFVKLLSHVLPMTMYACGLWDPGTSITCRPRAHVSGDIANLLWKKVFSLKQLRQIQSQQLVTILSYILQRWKAPLSSWIQRLILGCPKSENLVSGQGEETERFDVSVQWLDIKVDDDFLERIASVNCLAGAWWAIHEAARYCITTRLRTNLGGPAQTFAELERVLLDIARVLRLDIDQNDGNLGTIGTGAHLLPMRLLLDFVEALKKNVYNAYEGSAVLPSATGQSSLFFRANKKVCEEWFSRMCEPMMNAGLALKCHDATIQYSSLRLQELKNLLALTLKENSRAHTSDNLHSIKDRLSGDILRVLRHMALALCRLHESEALIGLEQWASVTFSSLLVDEKLPVSYCGQSRPFSWITGLAYQADGRYELAAAHFTHLLQNEDSISCMGSDGIQFVITRIIECYAAISDWKTLESWLLELQALRSKHAGKSYSGALTTAGNEINAIHALARFDEGNLQASWGFLDLTPKNSSELALDPELALQRSEQMLLQALLLHHEGKEDKVIDEVQKAESMLEEIISVLPLDSLAEAAPFASQLHCIFAFEEGRKLKDKATSKQSQSILGSYIESVQFPINKLRQDCVPWLKVLRVYQTSIPSSPITLKLCVSLSRLARKQGNLMLANHLNSFLREHVTNCCEQRCCHSLLTNLRYEEFLLMHAENKFEDAFANIWSFLCPFMVSSASLVPNSPNSDDNVWKAKACLKLSDWLRRDYSSINLDNIVLKMLADLNVGNEFSVGRGEFNINLENMSSKTNKDLIIEEIVGTAVKLSTQLCSSMGRSWICYASWCFNQAKHSLCNPCDTVLRSCSFSTVLLPEVAPDRFKLNEDERRSVICLVNKLLQNEDDAFDDEGSKLNDLSDPIQSSRSHNHVWLLVAKVIDTIEAASGAPGAEYTDGDSLSTSLTSQLQSILLCSDPTLEESYIESAVKDLINIWWSLRCRRVSLFGHAAQGFVQYLKHSSAVLTDVQLAGSEHLSAEHKTGTYTLRSTLYVLHILLNYGVELKDTIEPSLSAMPLLPWQEITPQLFARLSSHPVKVIREQLEGLLMMLAKLCPWSIVYPTLVDVKASGEKPSEELERLLGCLKELYPRLIQDVQLMISELENVTVLWEELWLSTLQDLHADVMRRINVLKEESARIAENSTLSQSEKNKINAAKYSAMMAPIVVALERRLASTSRKPETPHEIWFHEEYQEKLKSAILAFKTPPNSAATLGDVWRPFDDIVSSLASYQRKSPVSLGEVAPHLASLSSSEVPMPGLEKRVTISESNAGLTTNLQRIVTIASFSQKVSILPTKTRPKKLDILGSDGRKYTYLLKGREDLRLDARIMQLLQAINGFLNSSSATRKNLLSVRYYTVTPISGQAGLIQWVDNVMSIYSVFKSWQNRVQLAKLSATVPSNAKNSAPPLVPRPSDMFYGKIIPALKEKGIRRVISRRDWPHDVKRKVLLDLMKEVPKQLLHQELWCASEGFKAFSSKLKRYAGSIAAMSMVGHVLGLGDRHLDNILVDFVSGDVVHIDYNVCFDKGQRLKVPEIVPFRLTQMIEAALGLTGVEGAFRMNCEAVVDILRKNKDVILMLLEVFVWDPLVEWTRGDFHDDAAIRGEERKGMELAVSLSLFASRIQEIRVPLQEHHDLLLATLPAVESALEKFGDVLNQYEVASACFYLADQERSSLILHETSAKSIVAEATCNSEKTRASFEIHTREFAQAKSLVAEKAQEAATWIEQHGRILDALRSNLLPDINLDLNVSTMANALSLTSAVLVAGVPLTIVPEPTQAQCQDIDREVSHVITDLNHGLSSALSGIQAYSLALQRILPLNYLSTSSVHGWAQVLQLSANALSSDILSLARRQATELIAKFQGDNLDSVKYRHDDLCRTVEKYVVEIDRVEAECDELVNSIGLETESKAKDRLMVTFAKYMHSAGLMKKEDAGSNQSGIPRYEATRDARFIGELEDKKGKVLSVINVAVSSLYDEVKHRVLDIFHDSEGRNCADKSETMFSEFEEQVEKCILVAGFVNELQKLISKGVSTICSDVDCSKSNFERNWASVFKTALISCKSLVEKMIEAVLLEVMRSAVSLNSEFMDAYGLISQIRGSIDTTLDQLLEVETERASLLELEKNYFVKVGLITEQQLALEEAAMKGRDHLSWEEAEELASQEEACRAQLDRLHQTWNQRDMRTSSLIRREADIKNSLLSSVNQFQSLVTAEEGTEQNVSRSKTLLSILVEPFSELESVDQLLKKCDSCVTPNLDEISNLENLMSSGYSMSENIWKVSGLLDSHSFFIWKICFVDSFLGSCMHDMASSVDQNLGFDQLFNVARKKLEIQLQDHVNRYLKERVASSFLACLDKENEHMRRLTEATKELSLDPVKKDAGAVRKVKHMLEEYCNAHETARAARSAASAMKRHVNDLKEALHKTSLEIVQLEWMYDALPSSQRNRITFQKFLSSEDSLNSAILNLNRSKLLEGMQSAITKIARSVDSLQVCERNSVVAEGQLERTMGWACGAPNSSTSSSTSTKISGIPLEFHDHLNRRRQLLWEAREKASNVIKISMSILDFEASRDGIFQIPGERYQAGAGSDGRIWQQVYFNALTKLEVIYHSFARTEKEWQVAQSSMEAASSGLYAATNELCIASLKAKSASDDLQKTVLAMRDSAYKASVALSSFARLSRVHTALTSESGNMLEEVLAITVDLHDVHILGKEAATIHSSLMEDLSKANAALLPLESVLSKDVTAMSDAITGETKAEMEMSPIHGKAIYLSYCLRIREAIQTFKPLVPSIALSVKELYLMLTRLARLASLHAGNLHKALEGLAESQDLKSQGVSTSRTDPDSGGNEFSGKGRESLSGSDSGSIKDFLLVNGFSSQDKEWLSPPDSVYSSSSVSGNTSAETSLPDNSNDSAEEIDQFLQRSSGMTIPDFPSSVASSQTENVEISHSVQLVSNHEEGKNRDNSLDSTVNEQQKFIASPNVEPATEPNDETKVQVDGKDDEVSSLVKVEDANFESPRPSSYTSRVARGKNAYAMSVIKRVEMKIDGKDVADNREVSVKEQVDYLIKQAMSIDNLCNMYEGWTPWI